jgi:hypothetical protein
MINMKKPMIMRGLSNGLDVRGGRLINNRACSTSGIQRAAELKSSMKREKKVSMIAEGIRRAEMEKEMGNMMILGPMKPMKMKKY